MRWEKLFAQWSDDFQNLLETDLPPEDDTRSRDPQELVATCRALKAARRPVRVGIVSGQPITLQIRGVGRDFISGETIDDVPRAGYLTIEGIAWLATQAPADTPAQARPPSPSSSRGGSSPRLMEVVMNLIPPPRDVVIDTRAQRWRGRLINVGADYLELLCHGSLGAAAGSRILVSRHSLLALWLDDQPSWG